MGHSLKALIMAGGRAERMRATMGSRHKALVPILGVSMLERNLCTLLSEGFADIRVAVGANEEAIVEYIQDRGEALARARGATLRTILERPPRGTIGAARQAIGDGQEVLVLNVDNLTALHLQSLVEFHRRMGAAMTIAVHDEPFQIPFGQVEICGTRILGYKEKPVMQIRVSSGVYVLNHEACRQIPVDRRTDVPQLVTALLEAGQTVAAFQHDAPWVDVNEEASIDQAESLITTRPQAFEQWLQPVDHEVVGVVLRSSGGILIERQPHTALVYAGLWHIPTQPVQAGTFGSHVTMIRSLLPALEECHIDLLASFDDLDPVSRKLVRHHVYLADVGGQARCLGADDHRQWVPLEGVRALSPQSTVLARSIANLMRRA